MFYRRLIKTITYFENLTKYDSMERSKLSNHFLEKYIYDIFPETLSALDLYQSKRYKISYKIIKNVLTIFF